MTEAAVKADPTYFRDKMRESREGWKAVDCAPISVIAPEKYRDYFTATALMLQGTHLLEMLDDEELPDTSILEIFANRRPKYSVTLEKVDELRDDNDGNETVSKECDRIEMFLRQARRDNAAGNDYLKKGNVDMGYYHFAREYAQVLYIKGAFELLQYELRGGKTPNTELSPNEGTH